MAPASFREAFHIPTCDIPRTNRWYNIYQPLVPGVPTFGISCTSLWYRMYQSAVVNCYTYACLLMHYLLILSLHLRKKQL
nr:MAG TPA: hypothetical protein [Caudoviricetes sp.]